MTEEEVRNELEKLFSEFNILPIIKKAMYAGFDNYEDYFKYGDLFGDAVIKPYSDSRDKGDKMENIKKLLVGKTITSVDFIDYKAKSDTMILKFADGTNIKIISDPNNTFDGLSFYIQKKRTVEQEYDEEIK